MNRYSRSLSAVLAIAAIATAIILWQRNHSSPPSSPAVSTAGPANATSKSSPQSTPEHPKPADPAAEVKSRLDAILTQLTGSQDAKANRQLLAEFRSFLNRIPSAVASLELQSFLARNKDAATRLDVTIKPGGALDDASSLRVFLLDYIGQIDRSAAGALASQILSSYTTPDEWAVSLRNYAWANPGPNSEHYLQSRALELLRNPAWLENPSAGFLEAFDTIVYARGVPLTPDLAALARDRKNRAAAHAAYLTLDRLTINEPAAMMKQFVEQPDLMQGREQTRANFLARADVRQPEQRALVEQYLLDATRTSQELAAFAGLYPSANFMISNNLLTHTPTPAHNELIRHDVASLTVVHEWLADPRFDKIKPQIEIIRARLETFTQQAAAGK